MMKADLPIPEIPLLDVASRNLLLDDVGSDALETYVTYPGIALGDLVYPNWRGCTAEGVAIDRTMDAVQIYELDAENRALILIENDYIWPLDGGWVFYSFYTDFNGEPDEQSLRQFFYVNGKAVGDGAARLPVLQVQQSHNLKVDLETLAGQNAQLIVLPYQAMAVGDSIAFSFKALYEDIEFVDWSGSVEILDPEQVGAQVQFPLPNSELQAAVELDCYLSYEITYQGGLRPTPSAVQQLYVLAKPDGPEELYPEPILEGLTGDILDPSRFPDGLVIEIPTYDGLRGGDGIALLIESNKGAPQSRAILLDASSADSGRLSLKIEAPWLQARQDQQLTFSYHFGGPGVDGRSKARVVTVKAALNLPGPSIKGATPDPVHEGDWTIRGWNLGSGAEAQVPVDLELPEGPEVAYTLHWKGFKKYTSDPKLTKVFPIPVSEVPANLGKPVEVYYTLSLDGGDPYTSAKTTLWIGDIETQRFPTIQLPDFSLDVSVAEVVNKGGLSLELTYWKFMGAGQVLRIEVLDANNVVYKVLDDVAVTEEDVKREFVEAKMATNDVKKMPLNKDFDIKVSVSFDEGETFKAFPLVSRRLV
jgi:hypothetical protein